MDSKEISNYNKYKMTEKQIDFLNSIGIDPESNIYDILDTVEDYLTLHCLDENYEPNKEGWMCYDIIDYLTELENQMDKMNIELDGPNEVTAERLAELIDHLKDNKST